MPRSSTSNDTLPNGTLANGTLANGTLANGTLANGTLANGTLQVWDGTTWLAHACALTGTRLECRAAVDEVDLRHFEVDLRNATRVGAFDGTRDERIFGVEVGELRHAFCAADAADAVRWVSALCDAHAAPAVIQRDAARTPMDAAAECTAPSGESFKNWAEELLVGRYLCVSAAEPDAATAAAVQAARDAAAAEDVEADVDGCLGAASAASAADEAGEEEETAAAAVDERACAACAMTLEQGDAVSCGACAQAHYCCAPCQRADLPRHLPLCRQLALAAACTRWVERFAAAPSEVAALTSARLSRGERRATYQAVERLGLRHETEVVEGGSKVIRVTKPEGYREALASCSRCEGSQADGPQGASSAADGWAFEERTGMWHHSQSGLRYCSANRSYWRWSVAERGFRPIADDEQHPGGADGERDASSPHAAAPSEAVHAASFRPNPSHPLVAKCLAMSERESFNARKRRILSRPRASGDARGGPAVRDRAAERRAEHGEEEAPPPLGGTLVGPAALPTDEDNVGCKLLKRMGWAEGAGLGRRGDGMVKPVAARGQTGQLGLGSRAPTVFERYAS